MTVELIRGVKGVFVGDFQSQRTYTPEGFLVAPAKIARTGIQNYRGSELGLKGADATRVIRLLRPPEEVFAPEAMASFESQTVTDNHPPRDVNATNWPDLAKGDVHGVHPDGEELAVEKFVVRDKRAIDRVKSGKAQVSCGYVFDVDMTPGRTAAGEDYDGVQRNIRGNHVAIVQAGRAGPNVRIADSGSTHHMRTITIGDSQIEVELDENTYRFIADAVNRHDRAMDDAKRGLADAKGALAEAKEAHGTLQKAHDGMVKERDALKAKVDAYEDAPKDDDDDDDDDEDEATDGKKKGSDAKVKVSATDRYKRAVQRNKALKAQIPTADQLHAQVAALAQVVGDAKTLVGDAIDPKGKSVEAIRSAAVVHIIAKDEALKPMVVAIVGADASKASAADVEKAFNVALVAAKGTATSRRAAKDAESDAARDLGRRIHDRQTPAGGPKPITLGGRSDWLNETTTPGASS